MAGIRVTLNKDVKTREDLDAFIRGSLGTNPDLNKDIVLEAHPETLKTLQLSEDTRVYGVKVTPNEEIPQDGVVAGADAEVKT